MSALHTFTMDLSPTSHDSVVLLDGEDISSLLRGVVVQCAVNEPTTVELLPARGQRAILIARLPEARILIAPEPEAQP